MLKEISMRRAIILSSLALGLALGACAAPATSTTAVPSAPAAAASQPSASIGAGMAQSGQGQGGQGNQGQGNQGNQGQGNQGQGQPTAPTTILPSDLTETPCLICDADMSQYSGPLSADEVDGLLLALNDEYHAWAVYDQVISDFGDVRPFASIIQSEAGHISSLETLFTVYGVPLPSENPWVGQAPSFASTSEACAAGVGAEIVNADLYTRLFASTARADILRVYEVLQSASLNNHLPAFQRCA
jgi:hypothetical protein